MVRAGRRQVFGLMDTSLGREISSATPTSPSLPKRMTPSAVDGFRSHLPLRGSPGFTPDSL
jgi:hypothetical protein